MNTVNAYPNIWIKYGWEYEINGNGKRLPYSQAKAELERLGEQSPRALLIQARSDFARNFNASR